MTLSYSANELKALMNGEDPFADISRIEGEIFRQVEDRLTMRFENDNRGYFVKIHRGCGWKEIIKNLLQMRLPVISATNEWRALGVLRDAGITTLEPVGFFRRGWNPAAIQSLIITREVVDTHSLEERFQQGGAISPQYKRQLVSKVAEITRRMHENGINHRDCYICHFLLKDQDFENQKAELTLIDLHRAQHRKHTPRRWRVKDVGGLFYSIMEAPAGSFSRRDLLRFIKEYSGKSLRTTLTEDRIFWQQVYFRARRLYHQDHNSLPSWVWQTGLMAWNEELVSGEVPSPPLLTMTASESYDRTLLSQLKKTDSGYYVKCYFRSGRYLRRYLGESRAHREWRNLKRFEELGVPTARRVAFTETNGKLLTLLEGKEALLVTAEIPGAIDLLSLVKKSDPRLNDRNWVKKVIDRLGGHVERLHKAGFVHTDLKWRNILVELTDQPEVYIIDAPLGRVVRGSLLTRGKVKDLASLDKMGRKVLSRSQRLRFYLGYSRTQRLTAAGKSEVRRILSFYDGRE